MSDAFSAYLNFFRFAAACMVLVYHAMKPEMGYSSHEMPFGPDAVIAFFVLSGFVIANASERHNHSASEFMAARISRLWSGIIPAILLVPLFDLIGHHFSTHPYSFDYLQIGYDRPLFRIFTNLTFVAQSWFRAFFDHSGS